MNVLLKNLDQIASLLNQSICEHIKGEDYMEFELRYGSFSENKFNSSVPKEIFYRAFNNFSYEMKSRFIQIELYESIFIDSYYANNMRARSVEKADERSLYRTGEYITVIKEKIKNIDIKPINIRVSLSREHEISAEEASKMVEKLFEEKKERKTFLINKYFPFLLYVDFTIASRPKKPTEYRIEMEFCSFAKLEVNKGVIKDAIVYFISKVQNTELIYSNTEIYGLIEKFNSYSGKKSRFLSTTVINKPITLSIDRYLSIKPNTYYMSTKYDGERSLLYIYNNDLYLLSPPNGINKIRSKIGLDEALIDGELLMGKGVMLEKPTYILMSFDILIHKGKDVRDKNFVERYKLLIEYYNFFLKLLENFVFDTKFQYDFNKFSNVKYVINHYYNNEKHYIYPSDGVIFTPIYEKYNNTITYKWKEPELLTIDFKIKVDSSVEGKIGYLLYSYDSFYGDVPFKGTKEIPYNKLIYNSNLIEDSIYEFSYNTESKEFKAVKIRRDKTNANNINIAIDNWLILHENFDVETMLSKNPILFKNIYKAQKTLIFPIKGPIKEIENVLDINSYKGGNFDAWKMDKTRNLKLFLVDSNKEIDKRAKIHDLKNYTIINKNFLNLTKQDIPKVDIISCYYDLSFFLKDDKSTKEFIEKLKLFGSIGTKFVGILFDKENVLKYINKNMKEMKDNKISNYAFDISKDGNKVLLNVHNTLFKDKTEYLTSFISFKNKLIGADYKPLQSDTFNPSIFLSDEYNTLLIFNRVFEFELGGEMALIYREPAIKYIIKNFNNTYIPYAVIIYSIREEDILNLLLLALDINYGKDVAKWVYDTNNFRNELKNKLKEIIEKETDEKESYKLTSQYSRGIQQNDLFSPNNLDILKILIDIIKINILFFYNKEPYVQDKRYCKALQYAKTIIIIVLGEDYFLMGVDYKGESQTLFNSNNTLIKNVILKMCE